MPQTQPAYLFDARSKRESWTKLIIVAIFMGTLISMSLLGLSKFVDTHIELFGFSWHLQIPIGLIPYPLTFLCTDLMTELFGAQRARQMIWLGFCANLFVVLLVYLVGFVPPTPEFFEVQVPAVTDTQFAFYQIRYLAMSGVLGTLLAYLCAQFIDVKVFHYLKEKTKGKHLWLRNNASTLVSQFVDTLVVTSLTLLIFHMNNQIEPDLNFISVMVSCYAFKLTITVLDTIPMYALVWGIKKHVLNENSER